LKTENPSISVKFPNKVFISQNKVIVSENKLRIFRNKENWIIFRKVKRKKNQFWLLSSGKVKKCWKNYTRCKPKLGMQSKVIRKIAKEKKSIFAKNCTNYLRIPYQRKKLKVSLKTTNNFSVNTNWGKSPLRIIVNLRNWIEKKTLKTNIKNLKKKNPRKSSVSVKK
jgi:hypothetical protein